MQFADRLLPPNSGLAIYTRCRLLEQERSDVCSGVTNDKTQNEYNTSALHPFADVKADIRFRR
jgi:hypothetical protein